MGKRSATVSAVLGERLDFAWSMAIIGIDVNELAHGCCCHEADFEAAGLKVLRVAATVT
jgi:hypothetical protein